MWLSRICCSVHMWMQNHAVFMKMSPTQCGLQADRMPVTKIHTSPLGQSVTLLSPKPEPQSNQSKQNPFNSQESRETRTLFEFVTVEITASTSVKASTYRICHENQVAFCHKLGNQVESY